MIRIEELEVGKYYFDESRKDLYIVLKIMLPKLNSHSSIIEVHNYRNNRREVWDLGPLGWPYDRVVYDNELQLLLLATL